MSSSREDEYVKGDWIDVLRKHILETVAANDALAFYGVILLKGGKVESICVGHPNLPIQHLYDHVLQCLSEDISMEMEK